MHDGCDNWWNPVQEWTVEARDTLDPNEQREINRGEDEPPYRLTVNNSGFNDSRFMALPGRLPSAPRIRCIFSRA